jgi:methionine-S-sulfoxide reductase
MNNTIYLAGGCFWGLQKYLDNIKGVDATLVGYANGDNPNTSYKLVCGGSGHAEVCQVEYSDDLSTQQLLDYFVQVINPYSVNKQGNDVGVQYRTGIYYTDTNIGDIAHKWLLHLQSTSPKNITIECLPLVHFCPAEPEHQKYLDNNPHGYCHIPRSMFDQVRVKSGKN